MKAGLFMKSRQEQAVDIAKLFINSNTDATYKDIIDFLIEHGFNQVNSKYGADMCGIDWSKRALEYARSITNDEYSIPYGDLYKQILDMGCTTFQADYVMDHCGVNWQEQAIDNAVVKTLDTPMSHDEVYAFLATECGYPDEEAMYGADHCNIDWGMQAHKIVEEYLEDDDYISFDQIIENLKNRLFSYEQIIQALQNITPDWNDQVSKAALQYIEEFPKASNEDLEKYLNGEHFSREQIEYALSIYEIDQQRMIKEDIIPVDKMTYAESIKYLIKFGYKADRAERTINSLGEAYWNKRALKEAEALFGEDNCDTVEKLSQLLLERGYTQEQTKYAVENATVSPERMHEILRRSMQTN